MPGPEGPGRPFLEKSNFLLGPEGPGGHFLQKSCFNYINVFPLFSCVSFKKERPGQDSPEPLFAKNTADMELYPMLIEKAVAIMAGGFDFMSSISPPWAFLSDLNIVLQKSVFSNYISVFPFVFVEKLV